jgi:hypothetical protein
MNGDHADNAAAAPAESTPSPLPYNDIGAQRRHYNNAESTPSPLPYNDRSTGLIVFGVMTVGLGCLAGLMVLFMLWQSVAGVGRNAAVTFPTVAPVIITYVLLAAGLIWLGIGSILARRWARALLLIFSWSWLVMGVFGLVFLIVLMPQTLANMPTRGQMSPAAMGVVMVIVLVVCGVLFVVMPAVWTFFYGSRHVKATCEWRDPVPRWTDACPLPVLGLCLWLVISVPMMLVMPMTGRGVAPFFGVFLTGTPDAVFCLALAAIWLYAAWSLYRLETRGWWLVLIVLCVMMASSIVTFTQRDMMEMYRLMGYPEQQMEQIRKSGLANGNSMRWMMSLCMLPMLGYLLFIRRYLRRSRLASRLD